MIEYKIKMACLSVLTYIACVRAGPAGLGYRQIKNRSDSYSAQSAVDRLFIGGS